MSIFDRRPSLRWAVPVAAGALVIAGTLASSVVASADSGLPPKTAQELLVDLQAPHAAALSGTVVTTADLGLPELPTGTSTGAGPTSLATGSHTLRVWSDGPQRSRVALMARADEYDLVRNGQDLWTWSSSGSSADHYVMPARDASTTLVAAKPGMSLPSTPQEAAAQALTWLDGTTEVTTSGVATVAGRNAYELILTPKTADTLVARVVIAMDAETHVPLRVQAFSKQLQAPAFEVAFTSVDFATPDPSLFSFTPPPGATVTEHAAPDASAATGKPAADQGAKPTVVGNGWSSVVVGTIPPMPASGKDTTGAAGANPLAMLKALPPTTGPWGSGHVLSGTLFSVILTDDGRFAVGAVSPDALGAALATK